MPSRLREVWSRIGELAGEKETELASHPGYFAHVTAAVVRLPITATELIPPLEVVDTFLRARLGTAVLQAPGSLPFSLSIPVRMAIGGLQIDRRVLIEPRFTSLSDDRVYWTESPLPSNEHVEMLRQVLTRGTTLGDCPAHTG